MFGTPKSHNKSFSYGNMRLNSEKSRNMRALEFGTIYFKEKDYKKAEKYALEYLSLVPNSADGFKLLAEINEAIGESEKALEFYKKSLHLRKQNVNPLSDCNSLFTSPHSSSPINSKGLENAIQSQPSHNALYRNNYEIEKVLMQQENLIESNKSIMEMVKKNSESITLVQNALQHHNSIHQQMLKHQFTLQQHFTEQFSSLQTLIETLTYNLNELKESFYDYVAQYAESNHETHLSASDLENKIPLSEFFPNSNSWDQSLSNANAANVNPTFGFNNTSLTPSFSYQNSNPTNVQTERLTLSGLKQNDSQISKDNSLENSSFTFGNQSQTPFSNSNFSFGNSNSEKSPNLDRNRPLSELFKPLPDSWECGECLVRNKSIDKSCVACGSVNPNYVSPQNLKSNDEFRSNQTTQLSFMSNVQTNESNSTPIFGNSTFKFGISQSSNFASPLQTETPKSIFGNNVLTSTFLGNASDPTFQFGKTQNFNFQFSVLPEDKSVTSPKSRTLSESNSIVEAESPHYNDHLDSSHDNIYFQPIIPLPPKVDVKTGEENEEILYSYRAKLYRYQNNEWKERGTGEVKFLRDADNGRVRIVMRRDTVLKVCLNHYITSDIKLIEKGDKSYQWSVMDYSDDEPKPEVFAIRFKNHEIAKQFLESFEDAQSMSKDISKTSEISEITSKNSDTDIEVIYVKTPESEELIQKAKHLMLPINFLDYEKLPPCKGCRGCYGDDDDISDKQNSSINIKSPKAFTSVMDNKEETVPKENAFESLFASAIASSNITQMSWNTDSKPKWLIDTPAPVFSNEQRDDDDVVSNVDIHFKPVIPLPELVETKTGEEDETPVYSQRSKLYRFDPNTKEWKERGIGDFKILKHNNKCRYRMIMRRDQILKIACNHYITPQINLTPLNTSETTICWYAMDYSDSTPSSERFALKFKNKEILTEFCRVFKECQQNIEGNDLHHNENDDDGHNDEDYDDDEDHDNEECYRSD